jgi:hypothetical protein
VRQRSALHPDAATLSVDQLSAYEQSQPEAGAPTIVVTILLKELLKDPIVI